MLIDYPIWSWQFANKKFMEWRLSDESIRLKANRKNFEKFLGCKYKFECWIYESVQWRKLVNLQK